MKITIKSFNELTAEEIYEIAKIRSEVFVVEQNCVYLDLDGKDFDSYHLYIKNKDNIVAYCRVIKKGLSYDTISIGRVLTAVNERGKGYARELLEEAIRFIFEELKEESITIGAQNYLRDFYTSLGFRAISEVYDEDGIPHVDMNLKILFT